MAGINITRSSKGNLGTRKTATFTPVWTCGTDNITLPLSEQASPYLTITITKEMLSGANGNSNNLLLVNRGLLFLIFQNVGGFNTTTLGVRIKKNGSLQQPVRSIFSYNHMSYTSTYYTWGFDLEDINVGDVIDVYIWDQTSMGHANNIKFYQHYLCCGTHQLKFKGKGYIRDVSATYSRLTNPPIGNFRMWGSTSGNGSLHVNSMDSPYALLYSERPYYLDSVYDPSSNPETLTLSGIGKKTLNPTLYAYTAFDSDDSNEFARSDTNYPCVRQELGYFSRISWIEGE